MEHKKAASVEAALKSHYRGLFRLPVIIVDAVVTAVASGVIWRLLGIQAAGGRAQPGERGD